MKGVTVVRAIKPKNPVRQQADTKTQWNTSQVSLFIHFIDGKLGLTLFSVR